MKVTELPYGKLQAAIFKLGVELGEGGGGIMERLDMDEQFRKRVAAYMLAGALDDSGETTRTTQAMAQAIMGDRMIGPKQVQQVLGLAIAPEDLERAAVVPYSIEKLKEFSKTHLLVYGYPTTLETIAKKAGQFGLSRRLSHVDQSSVLTSSSIPIGWYLISREASDCGEVLPSERLATVIEAFYALSLHKMTNKRHFFLRNQCGLCNMTSAGVEVRFGLGSSLGFGQYGTGSHDYHVLPTDKSTSHKITVVLPDQVS